MYDDPIVEEVRKTRERLAEEHNFDVGATFGSNKAHWGKGLSADDRGNKLPNKRLHLTGIPLRSIPAGEP